MEIEWQEPPEHARLVGSGATPGKYLAFAIALREHRGRWAVLPGERTEKTAAGMAQNIRRGKVKGFKAGEYETALDGSKIYVRWTGPTKAPQAQEGPSEGQDDSSADEAEAGRGLAKEIRAWAKEQGIEVPDRGRLPGSIIDLYTRSAEQPRPSGPSLRAVRH